MFWNNKLNFKTFWLDAGFPNVFEEVLNYWNLTTTAVRFDISLCKASIKRILNLRVLNFFLIGGWLYFPSLFRTYSAPALNAPKVNKIRARTRQIN